MKKLFSSKAFRIGILLLLGLVIYSRVFAPDKKNSGERRSVLTIQPGEIMQRSTISGVVTPFRKTVITAPYQGYVKKMFVNLGDDVKAGAPIASVVQTLLTADSVFPLRSPFAGKVAQINKAEGEFVKASDASDFIARIDDNSKLYVDCNVPELDRVRVKVGMEAIIKASAIVDRSYKGVIREIAFAAREQDKWGRSTAVEFPMRLEILDFDSQIQPGMSVILDIITEKKSNVLRLRHEYIGKEKGSYFVTMDAGERRTVELGILNEEYAEITSGLKAGEKVQKVDFAELPTSSGGSARGGRGGRAPNH